MINHEFCTDRFPINAPQGQEMHLRVSTASLKAICESRPGHPLSSTWCFWVVHECSFRVQIKWISVDVPIRPVFPDLVTL